MNGKDGSILRTNTFSRCIGHAALPYGDAENLDDKPIEWRAKSTKQNGELYNGFAMITISSNHGVVNDILEDYYDLSGISQPVFHKQILPLVPAAIDANNKPSKQDLNTDHVEAPQQVLEELHRMGKVFDPSLYEAIKKYLAPILGDRDAALVACSDPKELKVVKNNFVIGKLEITADDENIDNAISYVCKAFGKSNRHKERIGFYYLLTVIYHKEDVFLT